MTNEWISVENKLPEKRVLVHIMDDNNETYIGFLDSGNIECQNSLLFYDCDYFSIPNVNFWKTLTKKEAQQSNIKFKTF